VSAAEAAEALRKLCSALKVEVIGDNGQVDYGKLECPATFAELERTSSLYHYVDPEQLAGDDARIAFWINVCNVLAIHGAVATGVRESVMEIPSFSGVVAYRVDDFVVASDEIENGILRRNAPHPASKSPLFDDDDPRLTLCRDHVDPRVHAALVCASTSCPPVAFYEAGKLDQRLDLAANDYVAADVEVDETAEVIRLPIAFRYYESDFGRRAWACSAVVEGGPRRPLALKLVPISRDTNFRRPFWNACLRVTREPERGPLRNLLGGGSGDNRGGASFGG
jgi:hypothetical protein